MSLEICSEKIRTRISVVRKEMKAPTKQNH